MRFAQLSRLFYDWGWQIKVEHYVAFSDYLKEMLKRERVLVVKNGEDIEAIVMFYITDDWDKVTKRRDWEVAQDDPNGHLFYIDKIVCKKFTKELHLAINDAVLERFPQIEEAMYMRAPRDRRVTIKIRRHHVV